MNTGSLSIISWFQFTVHGFRFILTFHLQRLNKIHHHFIKCYHLKRCDNLKEESLKKCRWRNSRRFLIEHRIMLNTELRKVTKIVPCADKMAFMRHRGHLHWLFSSRLAPCVIWCNPPIQMVYWNSKDPIWSS